jgi:hypothetical protein
MKEVTDSNIQGVLQVLVNFHYGGLITTSITVVGRYHHVNIAKTLAHLGIRDKPEKMVTTLRSWDQL